MELSKKRGKINILGLTVGLILTAIAIIITLYKECPSATVYLLIRSLLSTGLALIAMIIPGTLEINNGWIKAGGAIAVLVLTYLFSPSIISKISHCQEPFSITVLPHGSNGKQDVVLRSTGEVVIDLNGDRRTEKINENGIVRFALIPPNFNGETIPITVNSTIFTPKNSLLEYKISPNADIYIEVVKKGLNIIKGFVKNEENGNPIDSATISVLNLPISISKDNGFFEIKIPDTLQKEKQYILITKNNFKSYQKEIDVNSNVEIIITLTPIK